MDFIQGNLYTWFACESVKLICVCVHACKRERIPPYLTLKVLNQVFYTSFMLLKAYCILLEKLFSMLKDSETNLQV